jgi:hypothetical protein
MREGTPHRHVVNLQLISSETPVMVDLIQNVKVLFDKRRPSQSPPVSSDAAETTSVHTYGSLFLRPESQQSTTQHPGLVGGTPTSTQSSFSSLPSDATTDIYLEPSSHNVLSPLLGLSSSKTLTEGVETNVQAQVAPARAATSVETSPNSTPPGVEYLPAPTSVAEWRLHQSRLPPDPEAATMPQSPSGSVLSSTSDFPLSSATSLQTRT